MSPWQCSRYARVLPVWLAACFGATGLGAANSAKAVEFKPKAQLQLDYAAHEADVRPLVDDVGVRRARAGLEVRFDRVWSFEASYDVASGGEFRPSDGEFKTVALQYEGWREADVTIGQAKLPFSLQELEGSGDLRFAERALPVDAFALSRRLGVGLDRHRKRYTASLMVFGPSIDHDDRGRGAAARLTIAPIETDLTVVHLGAAAVTEKPEGAVDIDTGPESRVGGVDFVNTGDIDEVERVERLGFEAAGRSGPLSLQAEWLRASLERRPGNPGATFTGWYLEGSWVLTGERRAYKNGRFRGLAPSRRAGALELTARYSRVDLDDADVRGGRENNWTVGLNYHVNEHFGVLANYIKVRSERRGVEDDPDILHIRVRLAF